MELGEGAVGRLVQVGEGESMGLVVPQPLDPAEHPVVVPGLLRLRDVPGGPARVPALPVRVLTTAHGRVRLEHGQG